MNSWLNGIVDSSVQCWGCPIFDRLFQVISSAAASVYRQFSLMCILIFCVLLAFYILSAVWKNIRGGVTDPLYQNSLKPVLINSLIVFALLGMGVYFPKFITTITFEPVADITLTMTQSMINIDTETVEKKITYEPQPMADTGFYRPELRNKIILLMKTTITQFQGYIKLGIAVMDRAFSWSALLGIGALIKHIMMFMVGLYLVYAFFKIFIKFCFYFVDIIVAMTFFAFLFPLTLVLFVFRNSDGPEWMKKLGGEYATKQFQNVINAIIGLAAAVLTYTVIMVIIAKFFSGPDTSTTELMALITSGDIFAGALSDDNLATMTLAGCVVLVYVINFIGAQVPSVTKMVMDVFEVSPDTKLSEEFANDALKVTQNVVKTAKDIGKAALGIEDKKEEKKDDKKDGKK